MDTRNKYLKEAEEKTGLSLLLGDNSMKVVREAMWLYAKAYHKEKKKTMKGRPESLEEVIEYFESQKIQNPRLHAEKFYNFYEANGWVQGKGKKIKNWRACVKTWDLPKLTELKKKVVYPGNIFNDISWKTSRH